jgi:Lipase (class 3)
MPTIHWDAAIQYAKLVQLAESTVPNADNSHLAPALEAAGYKYLETFYANELATQIDPHRGDVRSFGFLALSGDGELVASIRGTATIMEWIHDAAFLALPTPVPGSSGMAEDGFAAIYKSLRIGNATTSQSVRAAIGNRLVDSSAKSVTICGHSLGGALATLLALDVALNTPCKDPAVYTFASPRTGNAAFSQKFNAAVPRCYRVANRQDLVTHLPPMLPIPYEHVNTKFELNCSREAIESGAISPTIAGMHHLTSYLWLMQQMVRPSQAPL